MSQGLIGGLALLALLAQAQTSQNTTVSQIRPYTIDVFKAGEGAPKKQGPVIVSHDVRPRVFEMGSRVERGPCNMPIIVANPRVDPKMIFPVEQRIVDPKTRPVEPPACGGALKAAVRK